MKITAIIMASGMSKRMSIDKLHMKLNNKNIYEHILETIKQYQFYEVMVVAKDDDILQKAEQMGFIGVRNTKYFLGQSESIKAGVKNAKPCDGFVFFVADQPFISISTVVKLCHQFKNNPSSIILPYYNGTKGNPVLFPYDLRDELLLLEGDQGGKVIIQNHINRVVQVDIVTHNEWLDIDTIEDYKNAKNIRREFES